MNTGLHIRENFSDGLMQPEWAVTSYLTQLNLKLTIGATSSSKPLGHAHCPSKAFGRVAFLGRVWAAHFSHAPLSLPLSNLKTEFFTLSHAKKLSNRQPLPKPTPQLHRFANSQSKALPNRPFEPGLHLYASEQTFEITVLFSQTNSDS